MPKKNAVITKTMADVLFERLQATAEERLGFEKEARRCRKVEGLIISLLAEEGLKVSENPSAGYSISETRRKG